MFWKLKMIKRKWGSRGLQQLVATADSHNSRKEWALAAQSYRAALEIDPGLSALWVQLGHCEKEAGKVEDARRAYEKAAESDPNNSDALVHLGHLLKSIGDRIGAFRTLKTVFDRTQDSSLESELKALVGTSRPFAEFLSNVEKVFDADFYLQSNPDVAASGLDPLLHFMVFGWKERRAASPETGSRVFDPFYKKGAEGIRYANPVALSVVMPTYNRASVLEATLQRLLAIIGDDPIEIVVIDDGSGDRTPDVLAQAAERSDRLIYQSIRNGGPGRARNLGASMARGEIVLFVGDDTQPVNSDLFRAHYQAHRVNMSLGHAVLGKVVWPNDKLNMPNTVMTLIQGDGQQQFDYKFMRPWQKYAPWLFYTANVSVKRNIVEDWNKEGFDASFTLAAFEDAEFAYRMSKRYEDFGVFYTPNAIVEHYHPYDVEGFMRRQVNCGLMIDVLIRKHPELSPLVLGQQLHEILSAAQLTSTGRESPAHHYSTMIEGIRAWALVIDHHQGLGSQNWHTDFLSAVFRLSLLDAYLMLRTDRPAVQASAYRYLVEDFRAQMGRALATEVFGDYQLMNLL